MKELKEIEQNVFYSTDKTVELNRDSYEWLIEQVEKMNREIADREDSHIELYYRMTVAEDKVHDLEKTLRLIAKNLFEPITIGEILEDVLGEVEY